MGVMGVGSKDQHRKGPKMSKEPAHGQPGDHSTHGGGTSPLQEFISLIVPEPDLPEEETTTDPDIEPRVTGA